MKTGLQTLVLASTLVYTGLLCAQPQLDGYWGPMFAPSTEGEALLKKLPKGAVFVDDAGGGELGEGEFSGLQLTDRARKEVEEYNFQQEFSREFACTPPSVAFYMQAPFPIEIHQSDKFIVMQIEYFDLYRLIFLDGREHPLDGPHSKNGHSVGHWEGDELVVDTVNISSSTFLNNGFNHSDNLHLVERFKMSADGNALFLTQVSDDPEVFSGLAARYMAWRKVPGEHVYPYECDPTFGD